MCSCGEAWPQATKEEALRWARGHGTSVSYEIVESVDLGWEWRSAGRFAGERQDDLVASSRRAHLSTFCQQVFLLAAPIWTTLAGLSETYAPTTARASTT